MRKILIYTILLLLVLGLFSLLSCGSIEKNKQQHQPARTINSSYIKVEAESFSKASGDIEINQLNGGNEYVSIDSAGWIALDVNIMIPGRYQSQICFSTSSNEGVNCWVEDYIDNKDDRTYNITGNISMASPSSTFTTLHKDGTPLNSGLHKMKIHFDQKINIDWLAFKLIRKHTETLKTITQQTTGKEWVLAWSDEFDEPAVDTTKWTYDIGDWGWGNGELQYYTQGKTENARIENGNLVIEARIDPVLNKWTSARLTTRGKVSFLYGKIEFRAKVPSFNGNWTAGWTLGDDYIDELSWPYCGEIDILESVGYEMDNQTGNGIAHASAHSGAYYFKLGNQPTGVIDVENMNTQYHIYSVEWMPDGIKAYVDGRLYVTYNDTSTDLSWPFSRPQNIILNMAIGGGWGGSQGIDQLAKSKKMIVDYVRVYELN